MSSDKVRGLVGVYVLEEHLEISKNLMKSSDICNYDSFDIFDHTQIQADWFNNFMEEPLGFILCKYSDWYAEEFYKLLKANGIPSVLLHLPEEEEKLIYYSLLGSSICRETGAYKMEHRHISIAPVPSFLTYAPTARAILKGDKTSTLLAYVTAWAKSIKIPSFKGQAERYHHNQAIKLIKG